MRATLPCLALICVPFFLFARPAYAQPANRNGAVAETVLTRTMEAERLLKRAHIGTSRIGGNYAVLAVGGRTDGPITLVHVWGGRSRTRGYRVGLVLRNGVNSYYKVLSPTGLVVLGIKTNVHARLGMTRRPRSHAAVYVPYSPDLATADVIRKGRDHLDDVLDRAEDRLNRDHVMSRRDPNARLAARVPRDVVLSLLLVEHMSPAEFHAEGARRPVDKVLATIGLNGPDAYRYSVSPAGAGGIAQFIRRTYAATRALYPKAGLPKDFVDAMRDHVTAAVAVYCLVDWILARLPARSRASLPGPENLGAYVAASYNGGAKRALAALAAHPASWDRRGRGLALQTVNYVAEFRGVHRLLSSDT